MSSRESVALVTVTYGDGRHTKAFVESAAQLRSIEKCRVVIADNGAPDAKTGESGRAALAEANRLLGSGLSVVPTGGNLHYWRGAWRAFGIAYPDIDRYPDWTVICNNDILFPDRSFLDRLMAYDGSQYHVIAPTIISEETGRDQNPFLRKPLGTLAWLKWAVYFWDYKVAQTLLTTYTVRQYLRRLRRPAGPQPGASSAGTPEQIYSPHGAFMIFSREFFARGGTIDTGFTMYGEELSVAETARRLNLSVYYCPDLTVVHCEHGFMGAHLTRRKYDLEREAYRHVQREYFGG